MVLELTQTSYTVGCIIPVNMQKHKDFSYLIYRLSATELWGWKKTYRMSVNDLYDSDLVLFTAYLRHS
jgi:hypothetical protein